MRMQLSNRPTCPVNADSRERLATESLYVSRLELIMKLPADYLEIIDEGAAVLRALGAQLRREIAANPNAPELWLSVRDYEGLAGRLADSDESEWHGGWVNLLLSGQDFGVLDELIARSDDPPVLVSSEQAAALSRMRRFLREYCDREFELDQPSAEQTR
jgi:hypothetical protein